MGNGLNRMGVCNLSSDTVKAVNSHTWCSPLFLTDNRWEICIYDILVVELLKVTDTKKDGVMLLQILKSFLKECRYYIYDSNKCDIYHPNF